MTTHHSRLAALFIFFFVGEVSAQVPNIFQSGQPIRADEVNQNFNYVLENASGGCSASQQGSNVLISCSDGSSGVLAGAGTVVIFPEGQIGEEPLATYPTGAVVFQDAGGQILAKAEVKVSSTVANLVDEGELLAALVNLPDDSGVVLTGWGGGGDVYYLTDDCSGQVFTTDSSISTKRSLREVDGRYYIASRDIEAQEILTRSQRDAGTGSLPYLYRPAGECRAIDALINGFPAVEYTPSDAIRDAVAPVRLEQLP